MKSKVEFRLQFCIIWAYLNTFKQDLGKIEKDISRNRRRVHDSE